jgi:hypothetical protein
MTLDERIRAWTYRRQGLDRSLDGPLDALERVIGVHGTHPPAPVSLLARTPGFDYPAFERLERDRLAVGMAAMRGSVHLVPAATAPLVFAATREATSRILKRFGTDPDDPRDFDAMRADLLPKLQQPVDGKGIRVTLGITDREYFAIRLMSRTGDVLRLSTHPRADRLQYVATEAWLGAPFADTPPDEARRWLAGAYLEAFAPARVRDFAWWVGLSQRDARSAMEALPLVDLGDGLLVPEAHVPAFEQTGLLDPEVLAILPKWDSYTMGHAPDGRQRLVDDDHLRSAYSTADTRSGATTGDGFPLILRGGRAVARWDHRFSGAKMAVTVSPFSGEPVDLDWLEEGMREVGALLGCDTVMLDLAEATA